MELWTLLPKGLLYVGMSLVLFHSFLLLFPKEKLLNSPLKPYILLMKWSGLTHNWSMFAPNPMSINRLASFELEYEDGRLKPWKLDAFQLKDGYQYVSLTRYFRMHNELLKKDNSLLHESLAHYVLSAYKKENPQKPLPVNIHLLRFHEPENLDIRADFPWMSHRIFTYAVPQDSTP
ncbi:MAG: hypothetical protein AAFY71_11435 [Bacteroidota bacterium]